MRPSCALRVGAAVVWAGCIEPPPPQAVLEIGDSLQVAEGAAALQVAYAVPGESPTSGRLSLPTAFPLRVALRHPREGTFAVTVVALDVNGTALAWGSAALRFVAARRNELDLQRLELVPWLAGQCGDGLGDCPPSASCATSSCIAFVLNVGACEYTAHDEVCSESQYCDVELGCLKLCDDSASCTEFDVCDPGACEVGRCVYGVAPAADGTACGAGGSCLSGRCED